MYNTLEYIQLVFRIPTTYICNEESIDNGMLGMARQSTRSQMQYDGSSSFFTFMMLVCWFIFNCNSVSNGSVQLSQGGIFFLFFFFGF